MEKHGISQLPVIGRKGRVAGSLQEITIMRALTQTRFSRNKIFIKKVGNLMEKPFPMVSPETDIEEISSLLLQGNPAVLVTDRGKNVGIITKIDLIKAFSSR
jgi:cystathionine beta-synthase